MFELVTEEEKNYEERLSPDSNMYLPHIMIQRFLQILLKSRPSSTRPSLYLTMAQSLVEDIILRVILFDRKIFG